MVYCDRSVLKGTFFFCRTTYHSVSTCPSIGRIFVKLHTSHLILNRYNRCDWSIILGILIGERSTCRAYLGLHYRKFMTLHTPHFSRMRYYGCTFGSDQPIIYETLFEKHVPFRPYVDFHYRDFP